VLTINCKLGSHAQKNNSETTKQELVIEWQAKCLLCSML